MTGMVLPSLPQAVFFKGSVVIWTRWLIKDVGDRQAYHTSINTAAAKILRDIDGGRLSHIDGANRAVTCATFFCRKCGTQPAPSGLLIARYLKYTGGTVEHYLDKNARE